MADALIVMALVLVSVGVVVALRISMRRSQPSAQAGRAFEELESTDIASLPDTGRVRLRGRVEASDAGLLVTQHHRESALGFNLRMSHHEGEGGLRWAEESHCRDFWLTDDTGRTFVQIDGPAHLPADKTVQGDKSEGPAMPEWMRPIWARNGLGLTPNVGAHNFFEVFETLLQPGDEIEMLGFARGTYDAGNRSVSVGADPEHGIWITPSPEPR